MRARSSDALAEAGRPRVLDDVGVELALGDSSIGSILNSSSFRLSFPPEFSIASSPFGALGGSVANVKHVQFRSELLKRLGWRTVSPQARPCLSSSLDFHPSRAAVTRGVACVAHIGDQGQRCPRLATRGDVHWLENFNNPRDDRPEEYACPEVRVSPRVRVAHRW